MKHPRSPFDLLVVARAQRKRLGKGARNKGNHLLTAKEVSELFGLRMSKRSSNRRGFKVR